MAPKARKQDSASSSDTRAMVEEIDPRDLRNVELIVINQIEAGLHALVDFLDRDVPDTLPKADLRFAGATFLASALLRSTIALRRSTDEVRSDAERFTMLREAA